jgi:hypothetical protein
MTALDQARRSSDREHAALLQAQESLRSKYVATAQATHSAEPENYMLDLMTDASQDMAGALPFPFDLDYLSLLSRLLCWSYFLS